jgi:hypothetical protein
MTIFVGDVMTGEQSQKPLGKATAGPQDAGPVLGPEEWQQQLRSLQQWLCELLIKNEELRLALESRTAQQMENPNG